MQYTLMHKNTPVADIVLDEATGAVNKLGAVYDAAHLPLGTLAANGAPDRAALNTWWADRSIPASRSGVRQALEALRIPNTKLLLTRCFGLSLSDQYWVKPTESDLEWGKINFFDNPFSEDIGDVLLGKAVKAHGFDFASPDNTSDGFLKKRWKIIDGKRCLIKAGSGPFMQQPFNEVIASAFAERLGIPHVTYTLAWDDGVPYSVCEDFVTPDTELISAWRVMQTKKRANSTSVYRHYIDCCEALGVNGIVHAVDQMLVLDFLLANEDRHQNNFGIIRDADTLKCISAAPIFDSGSSLGYDKLPGLILAGKGIECKPFKKTHEEQLNLVSDFAWVNIAALGDMPGVIRDVLSQAGEYADAPRIDAIASAVERRIKALERLMHEHRGQKDLVADDVARDVAQSYSE